MAELSVNRTKVRDLSPLAAIGELKYLSLDFTSVPAGNVEELRKALPVCEIEQGDTKS